MKALILAGLVATALVVTGSAAGSAEGAMIIPPDARIYVDADSGFDIYLTAALEKRHLPLTVTTDKSKADYAVETGIRLVDLRSGEVVLAWPVEGKGALHSQRTAEALAKRLAGGTARAARFKASLLSKNPALDF